MPKLPDKRTGRKVIRERKPVLREKAVDTLDDAYRFVMNVKRARNLKPRTLKDYEIYMGYFREWLEENYGKGLSIERIDIDVLREYVVWCADEKKYYGGHPFRERMNKGRRGLSPVTVNVRIRLLRTFFRTLYKEGVLQSNPAANLELMKTDDDTVQPLTKEEINRLLKAPDQRYFAQFRDYIVITLMLDTGMRINEVCSLEIQDVDLPGKRIILPAIHNKNRKSRVLPISSKTANLLAQLTEETKINFGVDTVFTTNYGDPVNEKTIQKVLTKYGKQAGIDKRVTPHVIRHCFAKFSSLNGMDVFTLQRMMGHADISTTRKYVQMTDEDVISQHDKYSPVAYLRN